MDELLGVFVDHVRIRGADAGQRLAERIRRRFEDARDPGESLCPEERLVMCGNGAEAAVFGFEVIGREIVLVLGREATGDHVLQAET